MEQYPNTVRSCNCIGYLYNGGRCCQDVPAASHGTVTTTDGYTVIKPDPSITADDSPREWKTGRVDPPVIAQGWECPRCHTINAPHMNKCECQEVKAAFGTFTVSSGGPVALTKAGE